MDNLISFDFFDSYYVISMTCDLYFINQSQNVIWLLFSMMMGRKIGGLYCHHFHP